MILWRLSSVCYEKKMREIEEWENIVGALEVDLDQEVTQDQDHDPLVVDHQHE